MTDKPSSYIVLGIVIGRINHMVLILIKCVQKITWCGRWAICYEWKLKIALIVCFKKTWSANTAFE